MLEQIPCPRPPKPALERASLLAPLLDALRADGGARSREIAEAMIEVMLSDPVQGPALFSRLMDRTDGPVVQRSETRTETVKRVILDVVGAPRPQSQREIEADARAQRLAALLEARSVELAGGVGEKDRANEPAEGAPAGPVPSDPAHSENPTET